ncbi:acyl-CoA thioesterase [Ramlibacter sp. WS9]|uniref:acyl-CoA thioesterase n=1 Tax=Ramlibacter sp. WS9 TaxID=1882741 RepID=UPI001142A98C|nr:acyl-CoA thioesterase [Ramlibacter sp. WS9]ROZ78237.1 acyl-CoA thioesterase [Ramlibacter sp. WS9]
MTQPTRLAEIIFPEQANHYGTLFGGNALNLLGKAAFLAASRHARRDVVMAACSDVQFHLPVRVGQALELTARVTRSGRSSMTVTVQGMAETLASGENELALEGRFEMVAVDASGKPVRFTLEKEFA